MDKILLSTYTIKVKNGKNEYARLDRFNEIDDFYNVIEKYLDNIFTNIRAASSSTDATTLHITLDSIPNYNSDQRVIYGHFSSGVGGDKYKIRDLTSREDILDVDRKHGAFRNLFFYIKIPKNSDTGALILQRKSKYGIKILFKKTINDFIKSQGFSSSFVEVNNIIHGKVYRKMIEQGKLKKLSFIRKKIPGSIEEFYQNGAKPQETKGTLTTTMSASNLPTNYKMFIDNLFRNNKNERIEIQDSDEKFDELEFELELNGKRKTYYVINRTKIQPDIDVTANVEIIDGEATLESLVQQAEELYNDIIDMSPKNVL